MVKIVKPFISEYSSIEEVVDNIENYSNMINTIHNEEAKDENGEYDFDVQNQLEYAHEELYTACLAYIKFRDEKVVE